MGKIIKQRERIACAEYAINFYKEGEIVSGYPCTENGDVFCKTDNPIAYKNYLIDFTNPLLKRFREARYYNKTEPAILKCECGCEHYLEDSYLGACECPRCGNWHSILNGAKLNPVETWSNGEDW